MWIGKVRNITGGLSFGCGNTNNNSWGCSGAFYLEKATTRHGETTTDKIDYRQYFSASRVVTTASEVRPNSFIALPLIAY